MAALAALGVVLAAVVGGLVTYLVAARQLSGRVATTDAAELWKESGAIRDDYRDQIAQAAGRVTALEGRVAGLEARNNELQQRNIELQRQTLSYEATIAAQAARIDKLVSEVESLKTLVVKLQEQLISRGVHPEDVEGAPSG